MKIAIYGATGAIGSQIVNESATRGHEVTAFSRKGGEVAGVTVQQGDIADSAALSQVSQDHDVVVLATAPSRTGSDPAPWLVAMKDALKSVNDSRLLVVGGAGALLIDGKRFLDSPDFPKEYTGEATVVSAVLDELRESPAELDWTMLTPPPVILPGERTGEYSVALDSPAGHSISTQDFAVAMVDEIETPAHRRVRFTAAN